jgi:hypothetical protein
VLPFSPARMEGNATLRRKKILSSSVHPALRSIELSTRLPLLRSGIFEALIAVALQGGSGRPSLRRDSPSSRGGAGGSTIRARIGSSRAILGQDQPRVILCES